MTVENINVDDAIATVRIQMEQEDISPSLRSALEVILLLMSILVRRLGLSSQNSSKPPSQDPNREKKKRATGKNRGGQHGHTGATLEQTDTPDEVVDFHSSRPGHDLRYALDGTKLKKMGFDYPKTFEQSLEKTVHWYLEHPEWLLDPAAEAIAKEVWAGKVASGSAPNAEAQVLLQKAVDRAVTEATSTKTVQSA